MIPSTALQDAAALLTVAMDAANDDELRDLIAEFQAKDQSDALVLALVGLCRSLCLVTSKVIHTLDDALTQAEADGLTDEELMPMAFDVLRSYATAAARGAEDRDLQ